MKLSLAESRVQQSFNVKSELACLKALVKPTEFYKWNAFLINVSSLATPPVSSSIACSPDLLFA